MRKPLTVSCMLLAVACLCIGCASGAVQEELNHDQANSLTNDFIDDIPSLLAYQDDRENLLLNESVVIVTEDYACQADALDVFRQNRENGGDASLTVISDKSSFVISRIVFEDGNGYYLRCQHDPLSGQEVEVSVRAVSNVIIDESELIPAPVTTFSVGSLIVDAYQTRVDLILSNGDEDIAEISFANLYMLKGQD